MKITLHPQRRAAPITLARAGDTLIINGEVFDLAGIPEGAVLPAAAVASEFITGTITRLNGELQIHLILPHGADAPRATRFPEPLQVNADGPIALPPFTLTDTEETPT